MSHRDAESAEETNYQEIGNTRMNHKKLLRRLSQGALHNVSFHDMVSLIEGFGFVLDRTSGSHHIFVHTDISELINLQDVRGQSKPYQIKQFLRLVERYNMKLEE